MDRLEEIKKVEAKADRLYSEAEVEAAIERLAGEIEGRLKDKNPLVLCVLNGGFIAAAKLVMRFRFLLEIDAINASRYRGATEGSDIHWIVKPRIPLKGRSVLLIDDVLDEGFTLAEIQNFCRQEGAAAVYTAVLVDKDLGKEKPCRADFIGLKVPNRYLFGYGMDYKGYLRNAPGIFACPETEGKP